MLKKLSALLGALMLTASIGAVSIQAEDLINEDFEDCKPGVFTAANQEGTGCEMQLADESILSSGYTLNGQAFTEADIVTDGGKKVLRMNAAIKDSYTAYPTVTSDVRIPATGKAVIDFRMKVNRSSQVFMRYRNFDQGGYNLLRLDRNNGSLMGVKYNTNTWTPGPSFITYGEYHDYKYILDIDNNTYTFYIDDKLMAENITPSGGQPLRAGNLLCIFGAPVEKPTKTFTEGSSTDISKITYDGFIYLDSFRMSTFEETKLVKVVPAEGASEIAAPKYVEFTYNNPVTVTGATVNGEAVEVSYEDSNKVVKVSYPFANEMEYLVMISGITDDMGTVLPDAATDFTTKKWSADDVVNPIKPAPENVRTFFIDESFDTATEDNLTPSTPDANWKWGGREKVTLENQALKFLPGCDMRIAVTKNTLPALTVYEYDLLLGTGAKQFNFERIDGGFRPVALWQYGYLDAVEHTVEERVAGLTVGEWHNVKVVMTASNRTIYIDGKKAVSFGETATLDATYQYRIKLVGGSAEDANNYALMDNLKIYTTSDDVAVTALSPAFDAVDVSTAASVEFTFSDAVDLTNAYVTLNRQPVDASIAENDGKVIVTFDNLLAKDTVYAVALGGVKTIAGTALPVAETRFSTTNLDEDNWYVSDLRTQTTPNNAANKDYILNVRTTLDNKTAQLVVATFNSNGQLVDVAFSEKAALTKDIAQDVKASAKFYPGNNVMCFLWEDVNTMVPICGTK